MRAPSPSFVISLIALFVALGGTTYAATSLPRNSVGTKQLKTSAVTTKKIKNGAVTAAKIDSAGLTAPNAAALGGHVPSFFAPATLPSGQSESGVWIATGTLTSGFGGDGVAYPVPLAAALDAAHADFVGHGTDAHCAGAGQAAAGYLCVYAKTLKHMSVSAYDDAGLQGSDAYGFFVGGVVTANPGLAYGSWTVTAP
jgi:hypothetical protein